MISKQKIKDTSKAEKDFKYKKLKHDSNNPNCKHCKFDEAEKSLKDHIKNNSDSDQREFFDGQGNSLGMKTRAKTKVIRGKFDDVIAWETSWQ